MNEVEPRFTLAQVAMVTGKFMQELQELRREKLAWSPNGYTVKEIRKLIGRHAELQDPEAIRRYQSKKALLLHGLLSAGKHAG